MARKKNKQRRDAPDGGNGIPTGANVAPLGPGVDGPGPGPKKGVVTTNTNTSSSSSPSPSPNVAPASGSKSRAVAHALPQPPASPALIICRNKHWRYISSFHGPWLQLPHEILETLVNINYNTPRPRPIDPAVFYDLVKIRRLVDNATDLAVRAASGVVSLNSLNNSHPAAALGLGFGGGNQPKLSPERKHKLREQATQKLARAYRLDEIACSVATMQSASALEDVASLVLKRDPNNLDAKYVHFFHEKIPSRQLAESTSLDTLDDVISGQQSEGEPLRTRATVRVFKEDYDGAARDLTEALQVFRAHKAHSMAGKSRELQVVEPGGRRLDVKLDEDQQPSSLEIQLSFARAGVYLSIACLHVNEALLPMPATKAREPEKENTAQPTDAVGGQTEGEGTVSGTSTPATEAPPPELTSADKESQRRVLEARKIVKSNAKKALRDYMAYLSNFDYSPNLPTDIAEDFTRKVKAGKNKGSRRPASHIRSDSPSVEIAHTVYTLNELFAATPPADLPPYPPTDVTLAGPEPGMDATYVGTTMELVTYHPLITDALHALLLCHVLVQTSTKELQRHAYMVARLARLADGYPMFQASRSPARADWIEVLRRGENWIGLATPWESLCAAAPLYPGQSSQNNGTSPSAKQGQKALPAPEVAREAKKDIDDEDRERINQQALMRAIEDDRVGDEATLRAAISAHRKRAEDDLRAERMDGSGEANGVIVPVTNGGGSKPASPAPQDAGSDKAPSSASSNGRAPSPGTAHRRWAMDEGREYPILTERASAVARWLREAPPGAGGSSHSKKKKKAAATAA
ncbi:putative histidine kinase group protein [Diaporthe ampelina]|uniref:Putative histidine kinase group protein n=1 Tax=Diaporthe ampelina TaxID=1214573 RepID=A0A0G2IDF2_9PEZI|nr:putative histidine kinase group protein [Diaporthe ampelina]